MSALLRLLADRLGCTEGQAWTLLIGFTLAVLLLAGTIPAVLSRSS